MNGSKQLFSPYRQNTLIGCGWTDRFPEGIEA